MAQIEALTEEEKQQLIEKQKQYIKGENAQDLTLIAASAFVEGMRDSGYKSTATAIDEFVDNSLQAGATRVDVITRRNRGTDIAILDNGHGMLPDMMRAAVVWGGTDRHNDREGLGRYGFGLPSAAVNLTRHYDVYSRVIGGEWYKISVKLDDIVSGKLTDEYGAVRAPQTVKASLPGFVEDALDSWSTESGTVIVLNTVDRLTPGYVQPKTFDSNLIEHLGLIYRGYLASRQIYVNGKEVEVIDPLFLNPNGRFYEIQLNNLKAEEREPLEFELMTANGNGMGKVRLRFSYLPYGFQRDENDQMSNEELKKRFKVMRENNAFFIVTRSGRQIDLVSKTEFEKSSFGSPLNNDRNWAVELDFDPVLDEEFGITINKQQVTFSEQVWQELEKEGVPGMIRSLRSSFDKDRTRKSNKEPEEDESRPSEKVMIESEKYESKGGAIPENISSAAEDKVKQAAEISAEASGKNIEEVHAELMERTKKDRYKVLFESLPGAPFYRSEYYGAQLQLFINMAHRFYRDLYNAPNVNPRTQSALESLLFALSYSENQAEEELSEFYRRERNEWSKRLETYLSELNRIDPLETDRDD